jgi:hypothetical protein
MDSDLKIHTHGISFNIPFDLDVQRPHKQAEFKTHKTYLLIRQSILLNVYV